jgi:hypothetical protein
MPKISLSPITTPFVPILNAGFNALAGGIRSSLPKINRPDVSILKADVQAITFDTATIMTAAIIGLAFFRKIPFLRGAIVGSLFFLIREVTLQSMSVRGNLSSAGQGVKETAVRTVEAVRDAKGLLGTLQAAAEVVEKGAQQLTTNALDTLDTAVNQGRNILEDNTYKIGSIPVFIKTRYLLNPGP